MHRNAGVVVRHTVHVTDVSNTWGAFRSAYPLAEMLRRLAKRWCLSSDTLLLTSLAPHLGSYGETEIKPWIMHVDHRQMIQSCQATQLLPLVLTRALIFIKFTLKYFCLITSFHLLILEFHSAAFYTTARLHLWTVPVHMSAKLGFLKPTIARMLFYRIIFSSSVSLGVTSSAALTFRESKNKANFCLCYCTCC